MFDRPFTAIEIRQSKSSGMHEEANYSNKIEAHPHTSAAHTPTHTHIHTHARTHLHTHTHTVLGTQSS